jgi:hypothetical protein
MCSTLKDKVNPDLLAFLKASDKSRALAPRARPLFRSPGRPTARRKFAENNPEGHGFHSRFSSVPEEITAQELPPVW